MNSVTRLIRRNFTFFISCLFFILTLSVFCIIFSKPDGFLLINRFHSQLIDNFFILFTNLGNGLFVIGLMVFLLIWKKIGWTLQIGFSFLVSGLVVQVIKHLMPSPRPKLFFGSSPIHFIYGITGTGHGSFPSGHTATIFAVTTLLCLYFPGRKPAIFLFLIAALTGFSRIYLSQHFPIDVLAGSLIGILISMFTYTLIPLRIFKKKFPENEYESQSIKLQ